MYNLLKFGPLICFDAAAEAGGAGGTEYPSAPWTGSDGVWQVGAEGETPGNWWDSIADADVRAHVEAKQYANPTELAMANLSLTKMHTGDPSMISIPGKDASPEDMAAFYNKLGRPENSDGYDFKLADGLEADEGMMAFGKKMAYELGLNPAQAQKMADMWSANTTESNQNLIDELGAKNTTDMDSLKTRWGVDLDKNLAAGKRVVEALKLDNALIENIENSIGTAAIVELMAVLGRKSDEGSFKGGGGVSDPDNPETMNPAAANAKIEQLRGDTAFLAKYQDAKHPGHADAVRMMERLYSRT